MKPRSERSKQIAHSDYFSPIDLEESLQQIKAIHAGNRIIAPPRCLRLGMRPRTRDSLFYRKELRFYSSPTLNASQGNAQAQQSDPMAQLPSGRITELTELERGAGRALIRLLYDSWAHLPDVPWSGPWPCASKRPVLSKKRLAGAVPPQRR